MNVHFSNSPVPIRNDAVQHLTKRIHTVTLGATLSSRTVRREDQIPEGLFSGQHPQVAFLPLLLAVPSIFRRV